MKTEAEMMLAISLLALSLILPFNYFLILFASFNSYLKSHGESLYSNRSSISYKVIIALLFIIALYLTIVATGVIAIASFFLIKDCFLIDKTAAFLFMLAILAFTGTCAFCSYGNGQKKGVEKAEEYLRSGQFKTTKSLTFTQWIKILR